VQFHSATLPEIAAELRTDLQLGLAQTEARDRREKLGANELREAPRLPWWRRFLEQFQDFVVWILIAAAVIAGFLGDFTDTIAILAIVLLNGLIGFLQQERAEQAIAALRKLSSPSAKVLRNGEAMSVSANELVPGDLLEIEAGDHVPADARLLETYSLQVQEASLTGESAPAEKEAQAVLPHETSLGDRRNMVYSGTVVATGRARAVVVATGMQTELGGIAGMLEREPPETTPLQRRLTELGKVLVWVCLGLVAVVYGLEVARGGQWLKTFLVAVSLAVAAVPEGLPAVVTLALAVGLQRMARRNALVRKLPSVETLGSVTVICSDKTGTLTRNEMTVRTIVTGEQEYQVSGSGYSPEGKFLAKDQEVDVSKSPDLRQLLRIAARCNNSKVVPAKDQPGVWQVIGDPTEGALLVVARKGGAADLPTAELVLEIPFDSQRRAMSVVYREEHGSDVIYSKGAPEVILSLCSEELVQGERRPMSEKRRKALADDCTRLAAGALRVLALAYRQNPVREGDTVVERDLVLGGLCGMIDPPREEARRAVAATRSAGIRPVMITGDHPETARAIASELGILSGDDRVLEGQQLESQSDEWLAGHVKEVSVYARVSAAHKLRVVHAWKKQGDVVAMTGDGVNDAPAVKAADIGIAMGITGTDVTKEASDMVLTDDNFKSIVSAVEEGRCIFENIQNVVRYLLSCNAGEVLFMLFAALLGWPIPLAAIQILWINLVTDGLPALALAMEPPDPTSMQRPPRPPREPVLTVRQGAFILVNGLLIAVVTTLGFGFLYRGEEANLARAGGAAFCILACSQLLFSFSCRSSRYTLPELGVLTNPYLLGAILLSSLLQVVVVTLPIAKSVLEVQGSPWSDGLLILGLSLLPVSVVEITKIATAPWRRLRSRLQRKNGNAST
jgi:Ca2+-transporting ATPase